MPMLVGIFSRALRCSFCHEFDNKTNLISGKRLPLRSRLDCPDAAAIHVCGIPVPADHLLLRCAAAVYKAILS